MDTDIQTHGGPRFAGDDRVLPFEVDGLDARGRAVQLGPMIDAILSRHDYPEPVARLLAEAIALTVLLGTSLKFQGKLIVQTKGDGPVDMLVADFSTPGNVRAYARYDADRLAGAQAAGLTGSAELLGRGV
ncbi:MAG: Hsp33 family molecular chaperone HslO, partial [Hoeflea sp.]|nr:Hsp33 family molecular chaperone HslO [Hoeflea sp.]